MSAVTRDLLTIAIPLNFELYLCRTLGFCGLTSRGHLFRISYEEKGILLAVATLPCGLIIYTLKDHHPCLLTGPLNINLSPGEKGQQSNGGTELVKKILNAFSSPLHGGSELLALSVLQSLYHFLQTS